MMVCELGKYGIKIKNYQAGSIFSYDLGTRDYYDCTDAMLTNSLFTEYMIDNGMDVHKEESTRDIICIEFKYGTRSYKEEVNHVEKIKDNIAEDGEITDEKKKEKLKVYCDLEKKISSNQDKYIKTSKERIREIFYTNGVNITYKSVNQKTGEISETVMHYKMLYRSPGKAKKGSCMFIVDRLYEIARDYLYMGIKMPEKNAPIVEIGAYAPLVTSTIVGKVHIDPKNILVVKDVDSYFHTNVISVETDADKHCIAVEKENYRVKNTLFDGQALIDTSIFPDWGDGYILLRQHFCKMAAFHTNIQLFMKDHFGDEYETATVTDMFGNEHLVKDILLITTDNAMKWLKFDISYEYWCEKVRENGSMFGIVKTAHPSKLGDVQRMSYQMINALDMDIMPSVVKYSLDYIDKLKTDDDVFLDYLRSNSNFSNDYEVLVALVEQNREFVRSEYFRDRRYEIVRAYVNNFKRGRVLQDADNLTIVGSPYAMLLHSVGEDVEKDTTFIPEEGCIQCFTKRFSDGEYLAEFRNPFNSKNNLGYLHNVYTEQMLRYFNFGELIVAVNMIHTDFQDRNNGSDQDSDSIYVTNQADIVKYAAYCYIHYFTIVNNIPKEKNHYDYSLENYAAIDNNLAAAQFVIGESSNLAQIDLTYTYNFEDQKYKDYICILSVLAQVAIDNAKRRFDIDLNGEIARIKADMDIKMNKYPKFWDIIKKDFDKDFKEYKAKCLEKNEPVDTSKSKINNAISCPMNWLCDLKIRIYKSRKSTLPMKYFFVQHNPDKDRRKSMEVESLIQDYSLSLYNKYQAGLDDGSVSDEDRAENFLVLQADFDELIKRIQRIYISGNYLGLISWLVNRAFCITSGVKRTKNVTMDSSTDKNKSILLKTLYKVNKEALLQCFSKAN